MRKITGGNLHNEADGSGSKGKNVVAREYVPNAGALDFAPQGGRGIGAIASEVRCYPII